MPPSIVIINKNDEGIKDTLESLTHLQSPKGTQIIVVDSSNHKLDWIKKLFPRVTWINFKSKNQKKISIPEQRNVSVAQATGDIIVFLDASCVPDNKDWLLKLIEPIIKEKEQIVRGSLSNIENYYTVAEKKGSRVYVSEAPTINLAVKREVLDQIGEFDEAFSYGSDMDLTWRAVKKGFKIRYIESAPVSHNFGDTKQNAKRYFYYGQARPRLYFKHPYKLYMIKNYEIKSALYLLLLAFSPAVLIFRPYVLVLLLLFLAPLPNNPLKEVTERVTFTCGVLNGLMILLNENLKRKQT